MGNRILEIGGMQTTMTLYPSLPISAFRCSCPHDESIDGLLSVSKMKQDDVRINWSESQSIEGA